MLAHFTNYRSRYGYPRRWAIIAELWWRLEHCGVRRIELFAYPRRKAAERRGAPKRVLNTALGAIKMIPECEAQAVCVKGLECWEAGRCLRGSGSGEGRA